jgi:hypothetical protein
VKSEEVRKWMRWSGGEGNTREIVAGLREKFSVNSQQFAHLIQADHVLYLDVRHGGFVVGRQKVFLQ